MSRASHSWLLLHCCLKDCVEKDCDKLEVVAHMEDAECAP